MKIKWKKSPNYWRGRGGKKIIAIVDHITAGLMPGCLDWMCNPQSKASAHYLVTKKGEVLQMVAEGDTAFHAGTVKRPTWRLYNGTNPNRYALGIEHECVSGGDLTEAQYQATLQLHKELIRKYNIPVDRDHIIGHYEIDRVDRLNDPGKYFPWERLMKELNEVKQTDLTDVTINLHGQEETVKGLNVEGKNYIPIRWLEQLGYKVEWDSKKQAVDISYHTFS